MASAMGSNNERGAILVLEDGTVVHGRRFGASGSRLGEVVFTTGMTGYQESLTDPSYHGQILVQTAPHAGVTGWNGDDDESGRVQVAGFVVRDVARRPSSWRADRALEEVLADQGVAGISGVDTRMLVRRLRERGPMRGGIFPTGHDDVPRLLERVCALPSMAGARLYDRVAPAGRRPAATGPSAAGPRVVVVDLGLKAGITAALTAYGARTEVVPGDTPAVGIAALHPDGVVLSNGPGDPAAAPALVELTRGLLGRRLPLLGICLGHQILGRALGATTYKMRYPHRGINTPVVRTADRRVAITAHNHGFAVAAGDEPLGGEFGAVEISYRCPNDDVVEGLRCVDTPAMGVQFHPEASAGPHDARVVFDDFRDLMANHSREG